MNVGWRKKHPCEAAYLISNIKVGGGCYFLDKFMRRDIQQVYYGSNEFPFHPRLIVYFPLLVCICLFRGVNLAFGVS